MLQLNCALSLLWYAASACQLFLWELFVAAVSPLLASFTNELSMRPQLATPVPPTTALTTSPHLTTASSYHYHLAWLAADRLHTTLLN